MLLLFKLLKFISLFLLRPGAAAIAALAAATAAATEAASYYY